jgi:hypothetical protein
MSFSKGAVMKRRVVFFLMALLLTTLVQAGIISTTGSIVDSGDVPVNLTAHTVESNDQIRLYAEQKYLELGADLTVDFTEPSQYDEVEDLSSSQILTGTRVDSYIMHFDKVGKSISSLRLSGSATFDRDILGVIVLEDSLNNCDSIVGAGDTTYDIGNYRGLELWGSLPDGQDVIELSIDRRTLTVSLVSAEYSDQIRVITTVPEPTTLLLLGLGSLVLRKYRW